MSRILRHVGNKDFKRTRQRQVDEQRELAAKKLKEFQEAEKERREIQEISRPYKSNWRDESKFEPTQIEEDYVQVLLESDWTPVAGSIANSTTTTFISTIDNSTLLHVSGLGGVETTPKTAIIDFGFGDTLEVAAPDFSQLGLQGYVVGAMMKRRENEDVNAKLDASQEYARLVNADVLMDARVDLNPEQKKILKFQETWEEQFNQSLTEISELPDKGFAIAEEVQIRNKKTGEVQTYEVPREMGRLTLSAVNKLNKTLKEVRANPDLEMSTRKKFSDAAKKIASVITKSYMQEPPYSEGPNFIQDANKVHEYAKNPGTKLYNIHKKTKEILGGFTPGNPGGNKFNSNFEEIVGQDRFGDKNYGKFSVVTDKTFERWDQATKTNVNPGKFEYVDAETVTQRELLHRQSYNTTYLEGVLDGRLFADGTRHYTPYDPDALMDTGDEISVTKPNLLERLKSIDPKLKKESTTINVEEQQKIEEILGPEGEIPVPVKSPTERKEITKILTKPKFGEYLKQNPVVATELVYKMVPGVGNPGTQSLPGGGFVDPTLPNAPRKASIASVLNSTASELGNKKPSQVFKELGQIKETTPLQRVDPRMNSINSKVIEAISDTQTRDRARNQAARLGTKVAQGVADNLAAKSFGDFTYKGLKPGVKFDPNFAGGGDTLGGLNPKGKKLTQLIPGAGVFDRAGQYTSPDPNYVKKYAKGGTITALPKDQLRPTRGIKNPLGSQVSRGFDAPVSGFVGGGLEKFSTTDDIARAAADPRARTFDLSTPAGAQQYDDFAKAAMAKSGLAGKLSRGASRAIPFVGASLAIADVVTRVGEGDYLGAALGAVSAVPGPIGWAGMGGQLAWDATNAILEAQAKAIPKPTSDKRSQAAARRRENQAAVQQRQQTQLQTRVDAQMDKFASQMKDIEKRQQDLRSERDNWDQEWQKSTEELQNKHQQEMDAHSALEKANEDAMDALTSAYEAAVAALGPGPGPDGKHVWTRPETAEEMAERMRTGQYVYHPIYSPNGKWAHGCGGICTRTESSPQWQALYDKYNADLEGLFDKADELRQAGEDLKDDQQDEWDDHDKGDRSDEFGEREDTLKDEFNDLNNKMGDLGNNPGSVGKYDGGGSSSSPSPRRRGGQGGLPLGTTTLRTGGIRQRPSKSQASSLASQASSAVGTNPRRKRRGSGVGTRTESTTWSRLKKYR